MGIDKDLLDTWKESMIEIKVDSRWAVIWDGQRCVNSDLSVFQSANVLYVVTAYNPGSVIRSEQANVKANQEMLERLKMLDGAQWVESVGRSLSGSHCEYGYAIYGVDKLEVDALALEFGQIGYYLFADGTLAIYAKNANDEFKLVTS